MRKIVLVLCFVLLMVNIIFSGCTTSQISSASGTPPTPQVEYATVLVTPTPTPQMVNLNLPIATPTPQNVYVTVPVPVPAQTIGTVPFSA